MNLKSILEEAKKVHSLYIIIATMIVAFVGIIMIICGFKGSVDSKPLIFPYLLLNLGGLLVFGSTYTFINELYLKKKFTKHLQLFLEQAIDKATFSRAISDYGISNVLRVFTREDLLERIKKSKNVLMLVIRNAEFFDVYCPELFELIKSNNLKMQLLFLNPNSKVLPIVARKFLSTTPEQLSARSKQVVM